MREMVGIFVDSNLWLCYLQTAANGSVDILIVYVKTAGHFEITNSENLLTISLESFSHNHYTNHCTYIKFTH